MGDTPVATRDRLVEAAGEVFAAVGYREATIREICSRAGANIAAVNYHFGGKDGLYRAVLEHAELHAGGRDTREALRTMPPAEQLRAFIHEFLMQLLDQDKPAWQARLMVRELTEPTPALEHVIQRSVRPRWELLVEIVSGLLGEGVDRRTIEFAAASVIGQCVVYKVCAPVIGRVMTQDLADPETIAARARHITEFSLAGMRGLRGTESRDRLEDSTVRGTDEAARTAARGAAR